MYRKIHTKWHYVLKSQANQAHTGERNKDLMKLVEHPQLCGRGRNELPVSPNRFCIRMFTLSEQWLKARAGKRVLPSPAQPETQDSHTNITAHEETSTSLFNAQSIQVLCSDSSAKIAVSNDKLLYHPLDSHWNTLPETHSRNVTNAWTQKWQK